MVNDSKTSSLEEPKERLERLLVLSTLLVGYFYIYIYQNILGIEIPLVGLNTLLEIPIIALIVCPLIYYLIIKPDPLQRSPSQWKAIRFFQNEFPSRYILERCERCTENKKTCPNYIRPESYAHRRYWFHIFHRAIEKEEPRRVKDTFEKGYTCKLVYYLSWILTTFFALAIVIMLCQFEFTRLQILFPLVCIGIVILMKTLNKVDDISPTGCWQAWREINRIHVSWLREHESLLVQLICQASGGTKRFIAK